MSDLDRVTCGSFGCTLPRGHNMGKADVPSNHQPAPLLVRLEQLRRAIEDEGTHPSWH